MSRTNRAKHVISVFDMTVREREAVETANLRPFFVAVTHYDDEWGRTMDHILHPSKASIHRLSWIVNSALNPARSPKWPTPIFPMRQVFDPGVHLAIDNACVRLSVDRQKSKLFPLS